MTTLHGDARKDGPPPKPQEQDQRRPAGFRPRRKSSTITSASPQQNDRSRGLRAHADPPLVRPVTAATRTAAAGESATVCDQLNPLDPSTMYA